MGEEELETHEPFNPALAPELGKRLKGERENFHNRGNPGHQGEQRGSEPDNKEEKGALARIISLVGSFRDTVEKRIKESLDAQLSKKSQDSMKRMFDRRLEALNPEDFKNEDVQKLREEIEKIAHEGVKADLQEILEKRIIQPQVDSRKAEQIREELKRYFEESRRLVEAHIKANQALQRDREEGLRIMKELNEQINRLKLENSELQAKLKALEGDVLDYQAGASNKILKLEREAQELTDANTELRRKNGDLEKMLKEKEELERLFKGAKSWRYEELENAFQKAIERYTNEGLSEEEAKENAKKVIRVILSNYDK